MSVKCAECHCAPQECINVSISQRCKNCTKESCCCIIIHQDYATSTKLSVMGDDDCCSGICKNNSNNATAKVPITNKKSLDEFFRHVKLSMPLRLALRFSALLPLKLEKTLACIFLDSTIQGFQLLMQWAIALLLSLLL